MLYGREEINNRKEISRWTKPAFYHLDEDGLKDQENTFAMHVTGED